MNSPKRQVFLYWAKRRQLTVPWVLVWFVFFVHCQFVTAETEARWSVGRRVRSVIENDLDTRWVPTYS